MIVDAYRVRIAATKARLRKAKVALFGTLNPDELGRPDDATYRDRRRALIEAGDESLCAW